MNAHAHLLSLGWAGPGHALDSRPNKAYKQTGKQGLDYNPKPVTNTGAGLVKPLMISQRKDRFGIGKKDPKHEPASGNEWWLKGFETALGNIGKSDSERSGTATPIQAQVNGQKHQGLYGFFIKGQQMEGTIGRELLKRSKKRKSDQIGGDASNDGAARVLKPKETAEDFTRAAEFITVRDKDEKRRKRAEKAGALEEFQQATQFFEARSGKIERKRRESDLDVDVDDVENAVQLGGPVHEEMKEERQERRRKRREAKAAKKATEAEALKSTSSPQDESPKRKIKSERKRRKERVAD
jgi:nucleolar protein TMA23